jgi:acyl-CoA thioesterase-1
MKTLIGALIIGAIYLSACQQTQPTKVACVGDSITEGAGVWPQSELAYPVVLDSLLGDAYSVMNLGRSATTMLRNGDFPYWTAKEFSNVFAYEPDVIIIKLGTNDTKPQNWDAEKYAQSYQAMIDTFKTISTNPEIFVCLPVPVFKTKWGINDSTVVHAVIPAVKKIARRNNLPVIDLYEPMLDKGEMFFDSIHPDAQGAAVMAEIIAGRIRD